LDEVPDRARTTGFVKVDSKNPNRGKASRKPLRPKIAFMNIFLLQREQRREKRNQLEQTKLHFSFFVLFVPFVVEFLKNP
jgi:hypothetical protein